ncbi:Cell shape-determining protein MreC [Thermoflexales bacterium]|nr:Cell shape-determining protein MreC [Thermoflexales bacterium]
MNRERSRTWLVLVLAAVAVVLLLLHEGGQLQPVENVLNTVLGPIERAASGVFGGIGNLFGAVRDLSELRTRNAELEAQNQDLLTQIAQLKGLEGENTALRQLLNFTQENPKYKYQAAAVIGRDPSPYLRYITINAGSREGLLPGMPVVTAGSTLIGRVADVSFRSAKVQLLNDLSSAVNVRLQTSNVTGLALGQQDGSLLAQYLPLDVEIVENDIALTSGLGGNLPRNLVVGQVAGVEKHDFDVSQSATLRPAADYDRLDVVLIITNFEAIEPADDATPTPEVTPTLPPTPNP